MSSHHKDINLTSAASPPPPPSSIPETISIAPLLRQLASLDSTTPPPLSSIAAAFAAIFEARVSPIQLAAFLTLLHTTSLDRHPAVISQCAARMRDAAASPPDPHVLTSTLGKRKRGLRRGSYHGGLCDIVGTGGDSHSTFNISTTASIIASPLLMMAKHGNRAQSSKSGSADVLAAISSISEPSASGNDTPVSAPAIHSVTAHNLHTVYDHTNYAFLFAPNFHPGMRHAATVRRELGLRTIFNLLGPLANPLDKMIEARVTGVARGDMGEVFAQALYLGGTRKQAMVVCGEEELDEISCAGGTRCWWIRGHQHRRGQEQQSENRHSGQGNDQPRRKEWEQFTLHPSDFGLPTHPLSDVAGGKGPEANAELLLQILRNQLPPDHPVLHFVLINVAALLVVSGVCDADDDVEVIKERGPGEGRWKEGVRLARWCVESGRAWEELRKFIEVSNQL